MTDGIQASETADTPPTAGDIIRWRGFGSGLPLLIDPPADYVTRLTSAMGRLITVPPGSPHGTVADRTLLSPLMTLPYPVLYGDESLTRVESMAYPFLHQPQWEQPTAGKPLGVYALTHAIALMLDGQLQEEPDGSLLAPYEPHGPDISRESWDLAVEWARDHALDLEMVNVMRITVSALRDPRHTQACVRLMDAWREPEMEFGEILDAGLEAAQAMAEDYRDVTGVSITPLSGIPDRRNGTPGTVESEAE